MAVDKGICRCQISQRHTTVFLLNFANTCVSLRNFAKIDIGPL